MKKNPWLAAVLSFIIAGLGQLYIGRVKRAVFFFLLEIVTAGYYLQVNSLVGGGLNILISLWSMVDAFKLAKVHKSKKDLTERKDIYV